VAAVSFGASAASTTAKNTGGQRAVIVYDYEKAEDNEVELREGEHVTDIEMVDADWWMGTNVHGETGLFPSNYVELVEDDDGADHHHQQQQQHERAPPPRAPAAAASSHREPEPEPEPEQASTATATALFDYEAAEDNEVSFPEGATITGVEFPDEDWWFGHYGGHSGLFPANYVQRD
jgi:hypothetical protein